MLRTGKRERGGREVVEGKEKSRIQNLKTDQRGGHDRTPTQSPPPPSLGLFSVRFLTLNHHLGRLCEVAASRISQVGKNSAEGRSQRKVPPARLFSSSPVLPSFSTSAHPSLSTFLSFPSVASPHLDGASLFEKSCLWSGELASNSFALPDRPFLLFSRTRFVGSNGTLLPCCSKGREGRVLICVDRR